MTTRDRMGPSDFPEGIGEPARLGLTNAGYFKLRQLTKVTEEEVAEIHGMGPKALEQLRRALAAKGQSFARQ